MPNSADRKRVDDVTQSILYPWVSEAMLLLQEAKRQFERDLKSVDSLKAISGDLPITRARLTAFIERADRVLRASSE